MKWVRVIDELPPLNELILACGTKGGLFLGYITSKYRHEKSITVSFHVPNSRHNRDGFLWTPIDSPNVEDYSELIKEYHTEYCYGK